MTEMQERNPFHDDEEGGPANGKAVAAVQAPVSMAPILGPADTLTQATRIETGRAIAEVQAMVLVAQARPRDEVAAEERMLRACGHPEMAAVAFYSYKRAGNQIVGPTVQLMRELLRCWGNASSGVTELQRLPGRSEMQAWAWDLEQNFREVITFWWNHIRERSEDKGGNVPLDSDRDIYELNANMGARREREMIRRVLPAWFVARAEAECHQTAAGAHQPAGNRNLPCPQCGKRHSEEEALELSRKALNEGLEATVEGFKVWNVTQDQIEQRLRTPRSAWGPADLSTLRVVWQSIHDGNSTVAEEFPEAKRHGRSASDTLAEAARQQAGGKQGPGKGAAKEQGGGGQDAGKAPAGATPEEDAKAHAEAVKSIRASLGKAGWGGSSAEARMVQLAVVAALAREQENDGPLVEVRGTKDLTMAQTQRAAERLARIVAEEGGADPHQRLAQIAAGVEQERGGKL